MIEIRSDSLRIFWHSLYPRLAEEQDLASDSNTGSFLVIVLLALAVLYFGTSNIRSTLFGEENTKSSKPSTNFFNQLTGRDFHTDTSGKSAKPKSNSALAQKKKGKSKEEKAAPLPKDHLSWSDKRELNKLLDSVAQ